MEITYQAEQVAAKGGYSEDRYDSWPAVAQTLLNMGYSMVEAEAIMLSKWTRWAADDSDKPYGKVTAQDLVHWMDTVCRPSHQDIDSLVQRR